MPRRLLFHSRTAILLTAALVAGAVAAGTAPASAASGTTYYVNCSAKQAGDGSKARPWATLGTVDRHAAFLPGDQVLLQRGTTCSGRLTPAGSGTTAAPIIIGAYGKGARPTVNGKGTPNGTGTVQLTDQQHWTIRDLHVTNATASKTPRTYRSGVLVLNNGVGRLNGITLSGLAVDSVRSNAADGVLGPRDWGGISVLTYGAHKDGFTGLRITGNTVKGVSRTGIVVSNHNYPKSWDTGTRIDHNTVLKARGDSIFVLGEKQARIDHNVSRDGGKILPCPECGSNTRGTASVGIWPTRSDRVLIEYNEVSGESAIGGDGEGFDVDASASNTIVQYNYAHDNAGGGILFCGSSNTTARFNIFENNKKSAIAFYGKIPAHNTSIYNNTIYANRATSADVVRTFGATKGDRVSFKNNLVYSYGRGTFGWPKTKVSTSANTLIGSFGSGRPRDSLTSYVAPGLKTPGSGKNGFGSLKGYKPEHPSSFRKGATIPKSVTKDFFGKRISPKHPPRGAAG